MGGGGSPPRFNVVIDLELESILASAFVAFTSIL